MRKVGGKSIAAAVCDSIEGFLNFWLRNPPGRLFLEGNYGPVNESGPYHDLEIIGTLPVSDDTPFCNLRPHCGVRFIILDDEVLCISPLSTTPLYPCFIRPNSRPWQVLDQCWHVVAPSITLSPFPVRKWMPAFIGRECNCL